MIAVRVWFHPQGEPERPWRVRYDDGQTVAATSVRLTNAETVYEAQGFTDLHGGPKAVMRGELEWIWSPQPLEPG